MATNSTSAPSTPSKTDKTCPNCGSPLFSGIGEGILACNDGGDPPLGCLVAWDPATLGAPPVHGIGPYSVDVSDKAAVPVEGNTTPPDPNPALEPYVGPEVVPASVGVGEDTTKLVAVEDPVPAPTKVTTPPPPPPLPPAA